MSTRCYGFLLLDNKVPKSRKGPQKECELCWGSGTTGFTRGLEEGKWYHPECIKDERIVECFGCGEDMYESLVDEYDVDGNEYHSECLKEFDLNECCVCGSHGVDYESWKRNGFSREVLLESDGRGNYFCTEHSDMLRGDGPMILVTRSRY